MHSGEYTLGSCQPQVETQRLLKIQCSAFPIFPSSNTPHVMSLKAISLCLMMCEIFALQQALENLKISGKPRAGY